MASAMRLAETPGGLDGRLDVFVMDCRLCVGTECARVRALAGATEGTRSPVHHLIVKHQWTGGKDTSSHFSFFASCKRSEYLPIRKYSTSLLQTKAMKVTSFSVILLSIVSCTAAESGRVLCSQLQGRHEELPCEDDVESPPESKFHIESLRTSLCFRKEL